MRNLALLIPLLILGACAAPGGEPVSLPVDEKGIDAYVAEKLDTSQTYEILQGMRFSKGESHAYTVTRFSQNDTAILYTETVEEANGVTYRNIFFKDGLPVFVEENQTLMTQTSTNFIQRKVYLNGAIILKAYERKSEIEEEIEKVPFTEITMTMSQFNFDLPEHAVEQTGPFEMKFGEFLNFDLFSYLVLENPESGYNVALYILKGDSLIEAMWNDPASYKGKTIIARHEFMNIGGMEQMVYLAAEVKE